LNKKIVGLCFAAAALTACAEPVSDNEKGTLDGSPPNGKKVFQTYCVSCHGTQGDLGTNGAFNLVTSTLSLEEKVLVITKGRNTMTAFGKVLSPEQIEAVALYTEQFKSR
jgi:cytochrome c6